MSTSAEDLRAAWARLVRLIEAREYYKVGESRRFLASQRRLTWAATRAGMVVVAAAALLHVIVLSTLHPADAVFIVALNGALGLSAVGAWFLLGHRLRRHSEGVAFVVSLVVAVATMALGVAGPKLVVVSLAYLMFLPTIVALVIPWRTWTEVRWLAVYGAGVVAFLTFVPADWLTLADRRDLIVVTTVALSASFTGHVLLFRHHIRTFSQLQAIARLHRRENNQRVELERVYRSLEVTARTDELTRVGNRLRLDEDLVTVRARVGRTARPVGLLEVDLDRFKGVNDALGHLAGDAVLREVAKAISQTVRTDDAVYRYGGEEFLVILDSIAGGVEVAAERVRAAVEELGLAHPANPPFDVVTVSVGATALRPADLDQTADEWFARVDAALYAAKTAGRNRVAVRHGVDRPAARDGAGATAGRAPRPATLERSA